jgi:tight adherence protein B
MGGSPETLRLAAGLGAVLVVLISALLLSALSRRSKLDARLDAVRDRPAARPAGDAAPALAAVRARSTGRFSPGGLIDRLLGADRSLAQPLPLRHWQALALGCAAAAAAWVALGPFFGLGDGPAIAGAALLLAFVPRLAFASARGRLAALLLAQFPDALGLMVRAVRSGIPISEGIRTVGIELPAPTGPEFRRIADDVALGSDLETALARAAERTRLPEYRFFAVSVALQQESGGNIAETLDGLADTIRRRKTIREKGKALSAEARMSTWVLVALPFLAGGGLFLINPAYMGRLFTTPEGKVILAVAIVMLITGIGSMQALIKGALK